MVTRARITPYLAILVRIDHLARLVLRRRYHDLGREVLELADVIALDVLELDLEHARLRPFALRAERHVADQGLERGLADVIGELVVIEAFRRRDCLLAEPEAGRSPRARCSSRAHRRLPSPPSPDTAS